MRTKEELAGADANQTPGKTSYTGTSVLSRTQKNMTVSECLARGLPIPIYPDEKPFVIRIAGQENYDAGLAAGTIIEVA